MNQVAFIIPIIIASLYLLFLRSNTAGNSGTLCPGSANGATNTTSPCTTNSKFASDKYYDKSQFLFDSLHEYLQNISSNPKQTLGGLSGGGRECKRVRFTRFTIDVILKIDLDEIIKIVLARVNKNCSFHFKLLNYESAIIITDENGNKRYIIDFFVSDPQTHYGLRLKLDCIKYAFNKAELNMAGISCRDETMTCADLTSPAFRRFYIGYPAIEQMIPLPSQVIPTGNMVIGELGAEKIVPQAFKSLYINSVLIENSTLTLDIRNKCGQLQDGVQDTTLPFSVKVGAGCFTPYIEHFEKRNKWPVLKDQPKEGQGKRQWPCKPALVYWDKNGIPIDSDGRSSGNARSSTTQIPLRPEFWASNYIIPKHSGEYQWLFNLASGVDSRNVPL